ncbi:MAG TPA: metallophosphoesterase [Anaeromyxobacter sp.]|nr:metallophosphoesterase [Anaeromyxobacter sp.]
MPRVLSIAVFLLVVLIVLGGMHAYVWLRLVRDPQLPDFWRRSLTVLLALLALGVPVGLFMTRAASGWLARIAPIAAATWLGVAFVLFCSVALFDLVRLAGLGIQFMLDWIRTRPDPPADPERRLVLARAVAGSAALVAGSATAFATRRALGPAEITEVPVVLERLPPALSGLTIAQITDLHVGPTIREKEVRRVVEQTNGLRPDVIAITGDLVDGSVAQLGHIVAELGKLQARHGVFFVTGNHEFYSGAAQWTAMLRRLGIRVLSGERAEIGDAGASIDLAGMDDWREVAGAHPGGYPGALRDALAGRDPERSLVLLQHQPRDMDVAVESGVELQISGHTHGGQIVPFNLLVSLAYPYVAGLYRHRCAAGDGQIFVSRGTGFWGPPMRLGSPPEIAKIVLTK